MAQPALHRHFAEEPSFDALATVEEWTAQLALELLPETNGPRVEVLCGSVIVAPHAGVDHQIMQVELAHALRQAAKRAGLFAYPEINIVRGEDLFIPDISVLRASAAGQSFVDIGQALMLVEIVSRTNRRKDVIDHPRENAAAGVPWYMRVEARNRVPAIALHELVDGEYHPVAAAAAGTTFIMKEPFAFSLDPAELLDE
jgi:Uma2 family endonuclease